MGFYLDFGNEQFTKSTSQSFFKVQTAVYVWKRHTESIASINNVVKPCRGNAAAGVVAALVDKRVLLADGAQYTSISSVATIALFHGTGVGACCQGAVGVYYTRWHWAAIAGGSRSRPLQPRNPDRGACGALILTGARSDACQVVGQPDNLSQLGGR